VDAIQARRRFPLLLLLLYKLPRRDKQEQRHAAGVLGPCLRDSAFMTGGEMSLGRNQGSKSATIITHQPLPTANPQTPNRRGTRCLQQRPWRPGSPGQAGQPCVGREHKVGCVISHPPSRRTVGGTGWRAITLQGRGQTDGWAARFAVQQAKLKGRPQRSGPEGR
jgi:hypothetical protein